jgi:hypothetical protein
MRLETVEPGPLFVPPSRIEGADPIKLVEQFRRHRDSTAGMPPLLVTRGAGGELMIIDGVTRATRIHRYAPPGTRVPVSVVDDRPGLDLTWLPRIREL